MLKCPFCGFDNEDGALFCEQCKSDLGGVETSRSAVPLWIAMWSVLSLVIRYWGASREA